MIRIEPNYLVVSTGYENRLFNNEKNFLGFIDEYNKELDGDNPDMNIKVVGICHNDDKKIFEQAFQFGKIYLQAKKLSMKSFVVFYTPSGNLQMFFQNAYENFAFGSGQWYCKTFGVLSHDYDPVDRISYYVMDSESG